MGTKIDTDYRRLRNRCPRCGHRLAMSILNRCGVITQDFDSADPKAEKTCKCKGAPHGPKA